MGDEQGGQDDQNDGWDVRFHMSLCG